MTRALAFAAVLLALLAPATYEAAAELATLDEATMVAGNWARYVAVETGGWAGESDPRVSRVEEIVEADTLIGWCFHMSPGGHVVVPVLKELPPVKSYSDAYGMSLSDEGGYARLMRDVLRDRVRVLVSEYGSMDATRPRRGGRVLGAEHRLAWDRFAVDADTFDAGLNGGRLEPLLEAGPLLTTAWHQGAPYNNLCPMGDGGRTVVGCVATAAAQIMRYHNSPFVGFGSHCYYWYGDDSCGGSTPGATLCADFDDAYDWENMPTSCVGGCSAEEQAAVAELCYEVGVAFNMNYGRCGSGAYTADAADVFPTYFGYSSAADVEYRTTHWTNSWFAVIQEEINLDRPMQYRILGHSIVCDGWRSIDALLQYHMNYGWADSHTAWYVLDELYGSENPDSEYLVRRLIPPDEPWEDVTNGLPIGDPGDGMGPAWCDYDGDGDLDLYFTNDGSANVMARNDGYLGFVDDAAGPAGDAGPGAAAVWGDYDNDGLTDLYLVNTGSPNTLMRNTGGAFADVTSGPLGDPGDGYGAAWADYDLDGDIDLYVANSGGANVLLRNDGGVFVDATSGPLGDAGAGRGVAWGDYDGDGDPDLYVANYGGANVLLRNDGGTFADATAGPLGDTGNSTGVAWADYDNDGDLDLYVANYGAANALLRNDGGSFSDVASGPIADPGNGTGVAWADSDSDGDLDLYLVNDGSANVLLRNLGDDVFIDVTTYPLDDAGDGQGAAWGDYDRDGRLDLVVMNRGGGNLLLRGRVVNSANFFHVDLEGVESNRSAIGARVKVVTADGRQMQEVSGGSGYLSQDSFTVEFGLGWTTAVDTLRIEWPSGIVNTYGPLAGNQFTYFLESAPPSAPTGLASAPGELSVTLTWEGVTDPQLDHYRVDRDTTVAFGPSTVSFTAQDTTYTDFPLMEVREYFYRVVAIGTGGNGGDPSGTVSSVPLQTAPETPGGLAATPGDAIIGLAWTDVTSPDLDHYRVERSTASTFVPNLVTFDVESAAVVDGPLVTQEYHYRVYAVDWHGLESAASDTVSCIPLEIAPSMPTGLMADSGDGVVSLDWDMNHELDLDRYIVYRDTLTAFDSADSLGWSFYAYYDDSTAENLKVYWYCVQAVDLSGLRSAPSAAVTGIAAVGGAVFVECGCTGYQNGTSSYPYGDLYDGIAAADSGAVVVLLPGECAGNFVIDSAVMIFGMGGAAETKMMATTGSVLTTAAGSDSAKIMGVTFEGLGTAENALECVGSDIEVVDCVLRGANSGANVHSGAAPTFARNVFADNYHGLACADSARPQLSGNRFEASTFADISSSGDPGPLVGGSLEAANDFMGGAFFSVFNTGGATVAAELNYWGDACVDSSQFYGPVSFTPWTDSLHVETYYECVGTGVDGDFPAAFSLGRNVPNPFNPTTLIAYDVPAGGGHITLRIYSVSGGLVRELVSGEGVPGRHTVLWDGTDAAGRQVASGVYFYRFEAPDFAEQKKMVLLK